MRSMANESETDTHGDPSALVDTLLREVRALSNFISKARGEIAAIRPNDLKAEKLPRAGKELEAIVRSTEEATGTIMDAAEAIMGADPNEAVMDHCTRIIEACAFQDLTGQRITKVVRALAFIEERVDAMMGVWHRKEFETMPLPPGTAQRDGDLELHGPNDVDPGTGMISQDDIDKLFG